MNMPFSNFCLNFLQFSSVGPYWINKEMLFIQIFFFLNLWSKSEGKDALVHLC